MKSWHVLVAVGVLAAGWVVWLVCQPLLSRQAAKGAESWQRSLEEAKRAYQAGDFGRAEVLTEEALREAERLGPEHQAVGIALHNLGKLKLEKGQVVEAEEMQSRAASVLTRTWGPCDSRVAMAKVSWADALSKRERYDDAEPLYQSAVAALEKSVGPGHPLFAMSVEQYAKMLRHAGRDGEAETQEARLRRPAP